MRVNLDIPDADLAALSLQFEARTPIVRDDDQVPLETPAQHVERALTEWVASELLAARKGAADRAQQAAEEAKDDTALASALLARHKLNAAPNGVSEGIR